MWDGLPCFCLPWRSSWSSPCAALPWTCFWLRAASDSRLHRLTGASACEGSVANRRQEHVQRRSAVKGQARFLKDRRRRYAMRMVDADRSRRLEFTTRAGRPAADSDVDELEPDVGHGAVVDAL